MQVEKIMFDKYPKKELSHTHTHTHAYIYIHINCEMMKFIGFLVMTLPNMKRMWHVFG